MVHGADFAAAEVVGIAAARSYLRADMESAPTLQGSASSMTRGLAAARRSRGRMQASAPACRGRCSPSTREPCGGCHALRASHARPYAFPHKGRLFCCTAICTKQVRLYLYKITTKFFGSGGKTAKYASKTAACADFYTKKRPYSIIGTMKFWVI